MQAEIITVGSELMLGFTLNTHSQYISRACVPLGIEVAYHTSVGDHTDRLKEIINAAHHRSRLVFLCGGLGPTLDDLTKETLAEVLGEILVEDENWRERLQSYFVGSSTPIPINNYKQALVFSSGVVFPNEKGTAPGLSVTKDGVTYICLPGPPQELRVMFEEQVLPFLHTVLANKEVIISHPMSFFGIGESALEETIRDLITKYQNPVIATYALDVGVTLRITARAETAESASQLIEGVRVQVLDRLGNYCYSELDESLEAVVVSYLRQSGKSVATAESCTGGLVAHLLTTVSGASGEVKGGFVSYTNEIKQRVVGVSAEILNRYGAVSTATAKQLAEETKRQFQTDFAISVTGIAGPTSVEGKPVGLVYISLAQVGMPTAVYKLSLSGTRERIQRLAARYALFFLLERLKKGDITT
jgi:nicotinamide-nucleotide amidase